MDNLKYQKLWRAIAWLLVIIICYLSLAKISLPMPNVPSNDKLGHFIAYFSLMAWFILCYRQTVVVALSLIGLGVLLEILQSFTGYRQFEWWDMVANSSGVMVAWLLTLTVYPKSLYVFEKRIME